jgi:hypothetical protein
MKDIIKKLRDIESYPGNPNRVNKKILKEEKTAGSKKNSKSSSFKEIFENISNLKPIPVVKQAGNNNQQQAAAFLDIDDNSPAAKAIQNAVQDLAKQNKAQIVVPTSLTDAPNNISAQGMQAVNQNNQNQNQQPLRETELEHIYVGAKVYPEWDQTGEPLEIVEIIDDTLVLVKNKFGKTTKMHIDDLVSAEEDEITEEKTFQKIHKNKMKEGAKVDRMVKHIMKSERKTGKSKEEAENIAWATVNKRGMLNNKNKKKDVKEGIKEKIKGSLRREFKKDVPFVQTRKDYAWNKAGEAFLKGDKKTGDRYLRWHDKQEMKESVMRSNPKISAARHEGKTHGLRGNPYHGTDYEDLEERTAYHQGYKEGLDERYMGEDMSTSVPTHSPLTHTTLTTESEYSNEAAELESIGEQIMLLAHKAMRVVRGTSQEEVAEKNWYADIMGAISSEHGRPGSSMVTLMDSVMALQSGDVNEEYLSENQSDMDFVKTKMIDFLIDAKNEEQKNLDNDFYDNNEVVDVLEEAVAKLQDPDFIPTAEWIEQLGNELYSTTTGDTDLSDRVEQELNEILNSVNEGNAFTGRLAKAREMGAKKFDLDGDGKLEPVTEYDEMFESWDKQLKQLINEGISISVNKGTDLGPDAVTITATDHDADELLSLIKNSGLSLFGDEPVTSLPTSEPATGTEIEVIDGSDSMLGLMQKLSGIEASNGEDYEDEYSSYKDNEEKMIGADWGFGTSNYPNSENPEQEFKDDEEIDSCESDNDDEEENSNKNSKTCTECGEMMEEEHSCEPKEKVKENINFVELLRKLDNLAEGEELDSEGNLLSSESFDDFKEKVKTSDDPFEIVNDGLKGFYGDEVLEKLQQYEDEIIQDSNGTLHPDDDHEEIVNRIVEKLNEPEEEMHTDIDNIDSDEDFDSEELKEWANKAGKRGTEHAFVQDIEFMTQTIAGGINKPKATGQTTTPVIANQAERQRSISEETIEELLKLSGIKK